MFSKGRSVRGPILSLRYAKTNRPNYRCAVVVSRKVNPSAVVRNRIRRRLYEIIREEDSRLNDVYDIALIAQNDKLATLSSTKLKDFVVDLLKKANMITLDDKSSQPRDMINDKET